MNLLFSFDLELFWENHQNSKQWSILYWQIIAPPFSRSGASCSLHGDRERDLPGQLSRQDLKRMHELRIPGAAPGDQRKDTHEKTPRVAARSVTHTVIDLRGGRIQWFCSELKLNPWPDSLSESSSSSQIATKRPFDSAISFCNLIPNYSWLLPDLSGTSDIVLEFSCNSLQSHWNPPITFVG